jgi:hypothetical protein
MSASAAGYIAVPAGEIPNRRRGIALVPARGDRDEGAAQPHSRDQCQGTGSRQTKRPVAPQVITQSGDMRRRSGPTVYGGCRDRRASRPHALGSGRVAGTLAAVGGRRADGVDTVRNDFDSAHLFSIDADYPAARSRSGSSPAVITRRPRPTPPCRSACGNDGDKEITDVHVSNGGPGIARVLGSRTPRFSRTVGGFFYTRSTATTSPSR